MKNVILLAVILASVNVFAGGGSSIGPANPASLNCLKLEGTLERIDTANGQYSNCVVEEWQLYRAMSVRGLVRDYNPDGFGMANPASVNCNDIGGQVRIVETSQGQVGQCVVEEWQLFRVINVTADDVTADDGLNISPANPASLNCSKLQGKLERIDTANGQYSNCVVEEWHLYREMSVRGLVKDYTPGGFVANPASVNCNDIGGQVRIVETSQGQVGQCVVEEWQLFRVINVTAE